MKKDKINKVLIWIAIFVAWIILTSPEAYKRYKFTKQVNEFEKIPFTKTFTKVNDITLIIPASWVMGFVSYAEIVVAPDILNPGFYEKFVFDYYEKPLEKAEFGESLILGEHAWCDEKEFSYSITDQQGKYRILPNDKNKKMTVKDYSFYCYFNWTELKKQRANFNLSKNK